MALIQLTAIVSGIKGSLAGTTFLRTRAGLAIRTKTSPILKRTPETSTYRNRLSLITSSWRLLSTLQKNGWANTAATLPKTNAFGQTYYWTGLQLFTSYNMYWIEAGNPIEYNVPNPWIVTQITEAYSYIYFDGSNPANDMMEVTIDGAGPAYSDYVLIYATPWVPTLNSYVGDKFRLLGTFEIPVFNSVDIISQWKQQFAAVAQFGFVWFRLIPLSVTGSQGTVYEYYQQVDFDP